ncbi:MAG: cytidylyltransferase domain-containing protein [Bacteroidota bacterium]
MKALACIPARGGSKRLPGKNILPFNGKPLIWYTINAARECGVFEKIVVSTDDDAIAAVAQDCGAEVLIRPPELATDTATTAQAAQHAARELDRSGEYDVFATLQPTQPFRPKDLFAKAIAQFEREQPDCLLTVSTNHLKLARITNGQFVPYTYQPGQRSQDLEPLYYENGLIYLTKIELVKQGELFGRHISPLIVDSPHARFDIDDATDFALAECYLQKNSQIYPF